jgi:DNA-binding MarR family transcriptional regulator
MKSLFKRPENSPGFLLWKLTNEWQKRLRQALVEFELTHVQFVFLASLKWLSSHKKEAITQSQLAEFGQLDKMVISETAQKLLKKRLIARKDHKLDNRSYALELTARGHKVVDAALPMVETIDLQFFRESQDQFETLYELVSKSVLH